MPISPSQELTNRILDRLKKEAILSPDQAQQLAEKLASGKMRSSDWQLPIELSIPETNNNPA